MGLIRKSLAVGTLGVVHGSSKKQRVAKATMKSSAAAAQAAAATAAAATAAARVAEKQAEEEREYRYATDPAFRKFVDDKRAAEKAERAAQAARVVEAARLRRERNQARWRSVGRAVESAAVAVAMLLVAILVWAPQLAVGKIRKRPVHRWMSERLRLTKPNS